MAKTLLMLNVGDKVRNPESLCLGEPVAWQVADLLHQGYPAGSVTLCSQYQVALYAFDGSEPENENIDRQAQGNNRYSLSNIRSWLNSENNLRCSSFDRSPRRFHAENLHPRHPPKAGASRRKDGKFYGEGHVSVGQTRKTAGTSYPEASSRFRLFPRVG
ncbi:MULTISPECIES: hypothetical protein [unclassified Neglectibacter]|uniref:hypothetical protein n=1 Tax=unclassified Neglectibacter TaxID=2632164 RepID=UPI00136AB1A5|nr:MULTISPECIES: hypothetical protein [unclassified Neglectibacter]